jgi:predicted RNase H-like nuclease
MARALVGAQHRGVFEVPRREVVDEPTYARACERLLKLEGRKLSRQSWALVPKLREVDQRVGPSDPIVEVHPELSFRTLAGAPLRHGKKTWGGIALRRKLLAAAGIRLPEDLHVLASSAPDDVLDAAVAAWSAHRVATGAAQSLPDPPEIDELGRRVAIFY